MNACAFTSSFNGVLRPPLGRHWNEPLISILLSRFGSPRLALGGPDKNKGSLPRDGPLKRRGKTSMKTARSCTPAGLRGRRKSSMAATISIVVGASWSRLAPRFADD